MKYKYNNLEVIFLPSYLCLAVENKYTFSVGKTRPCKEHILDSYNVPGDIVSILHAPSCYSSQPHEVDTADS